MGAGDDAFGRALSDHLAGGARHQLLLETDAGTCDPAMAPAEFFAPPQAWPAWEHEGLAAAQSPVLDIGCGAGRHALDLQDRGFDVTAIDISPGAVDVCRRRGVHDVRIGRADDPPTDKVWGSVLLMCGNLGLGGDWPLARGLLTKLATVCRPDATLVGDTVDPTREDEADTLVHAERNARLGRHRGLARLRLRYGDVVTPWWDQLNVPVSDISAFVTGTGWTLTQHLVDNPDHLVVLRRAEVTPASA